MVPWLPYFRNRWVKKRFDSRFGGVDADNMLAVVVVVVVVCSAITMWLDKWTIKTATKMCLNSEDVIFRRVCRIINEYVLFFFFSSSFRILKNNKMMKEQRKKAAEEKRNECTRFYSNDMACIEFVSYCFSVIYVVIADRSVLFLSVIDVASQFGRWNCYYIYYFVLSLSLSSCLVCIYSLILYSICVCWPAAPFFPPFCFDSHYPHAYVDWFGCALGYWTNCVGHRKEIHATNKRRRKKKNKWQIQKKNVTMNYLLVNDSSQNDRHPSRCYRT